MIDELVGFISRYFFCCCQREGVKCSLKDMIGKQALHA